MRRVEQPHEAVERIVGEQKTDGGFESCSSFMGGGTFGWTKLKRDCIASESFNSMSVFLNTSEDSGKVWFDKVKLKAVAP